MEDKKCLVELYEILNHLSEEDFEKIPKDIVESIKENRDKDYEWEYDEDKKLIEQKIDRKTIIMLSYLNMEYLLNDEQKELMERIHKYNEQKLENEKREKYNPDNIFKNNISYENPVETQDEVVENNQLIEVREMPWYKRLYKKILSFFSLKNG